jgi:hypothetical protein
MAAMTETELTALEKDLAARFTPSAEHDSVERMDFALRAVVRLLAEVRRMRRYNRPILYQKAA